MLALLGPIRRRFPRTRLSLRWALISVLVVGCVLGWIVARVRVQVEVVAEIERSGGSVRYDRQRHFSRSQNRVIPDRPIPEWLLKSLGPDYFSNVDAISVGDVAKGPAIDEAFANKLGRMYRLEILRFPPRSSIDDAALSQLYGLTELRDLNLSGSGWTGAGLVHLAGMQKLESLRLGSIPLRDEHLEALSGLTELVELSLTGDRLSDLGISHLAPLTGLKQLLIGDGEPRLVKGGKPGTPSNPEGFVEVDEEPLVVTSRGLHALSSMTRLHTLQLSSSRIDDLSPIRGLNNLRMLSLPKASITDEGLAPIAGLSKLDHLTLTGNPRLGDAGMAHLSRLTKLQSLSLSGTAVSDAGLPTIARITSLHSLSLGKTRVTDAGLAALAGLKNLDHLTLTQTQVTGSGLQSLAGLAGLRSLNLVDAGVTDEGLAGIAQLSGLEHLTLWRTGVTVDGLAHLAAMPRLRHLSVDGTGLSDADLPRLKLPPSCRVFGVWQTKLTPAGVDALRGRYPGVEIRNR